MTMASVTVVVGMGMTGMTVVVIMFMVVRMFTHRDHSTRSTAAAQPFPVLIRHYDTLGARID